MKVGIVCFPTYGGSGIMATELAKLLSRRHDVHLISYEKPVRFKERASFTFHKVELLTYPLFERVPCCYSLALTSKLVNVIRSRGLEIVHAHYAVPNAVSAYLAKEICHESVRVITTLHGTDSYFVGRHPSYKEVTQFSMQNSNALTAVSEYLKKRTLEEFSISKEITVIPNFVDSQRFRKLKKESKQKLICHSSNFRPLKRVPDIIRAFQSISKAVDCRLLMIGDGPERSKAERLADDLKISERIDFLGNTENVQDILGISDLFLLPSEDESFGLAALEAMSCQVPVIATRTGGLVELISDGADGYLVSVGDVSTLAQRSIDILEDPALQAEMGDRARRKVLEKYDPQRIVPMYEHLYEETLKTS